MIVADRLGTVFAEQIRNRNRYPLLEETRKLKSAQGK